VHRLIFDLLTATPPVLIIWPCKFKKEVDEEKSKHAGFAQQKGFGPTF